MMKVLATDGVSEEGIACLRTCAQVDVKPALKPEELIATIGDYEALIVRSASLVTAQVIEAGKKLMLSAAPASVSIILMSMLHPTGYHRGQRPTGNTISAAEHTIG